jgi:fructose-1,6-bisphosphatase/inositol monophosphatase family enzyme
MNIQPDQVTEIISETTAEVVMPRFQALAKGEVRQKASGELVTVADVETEKLLIQRLGPLLPGAVFVGEEATAEKDELIDLLADNQPVWVIDPIDGTGNFARGRPIFAVMVALVKSGQTCAAWIHDPVNARTAVAEHGGGAFMNGERLSVASTEGLSPKEMIGTLHAGQFAGRAMASQIDSRRHAVGAIKSLSCAGQEYLRLSSGEMHFSLFTKLMPWDHAPGGLIHAEAGGLGKLLDGRPYTPARHDAHGLLLAPDEASWESLHHALFGLNNR